MSEEKKIQAFNQELDRLLELGSMDGSAAGLLDERDHAALRSASALAQADFSSELKPNAVLRERWRKAASDVSLRRNRPALRWAWALAALVVLALLVTFRQPVAAALGRLFGIAYIPGAGFVQVDAVRVLKNPVTQINDSRSLTVLRGLSGERDTQLWLEYSDEARPGEDAWLEAPDGQRFDAFWWGWDPDEPGTRGVRLAFPLLPAEVTQVTLGLPEGWRIPLEWIPASESSLQPANLTVDLATSTLSEGDATPEANTGETSVKPCIDVTAAATRLCVQAAARTSQGLELMLEAQSSGELKPGSIHGYDLVAMALGDSRLQLVAADGAVFTPSDYVQVFPYSEDRLGSALVFEGAHDVSGRLTLEVPAIYAHLALAREITVDLGDDPQAGQEIALDETIDVMGIPVHFGRGELEEWMPDGLRLKLFSDPVEARDGITPYILMMGKPDRVDSGYGEGSEDNGVLSLSVVLKQQSGNLSGMLTLPLVGATVRVNGPFTLSLDAPPAQAAPEETPQVIEGGEFNPLPTGEALPIDAFQYSRRALQAGDLLAVSAGAETSTLYAATLGGTAEVVAVLPGQVLAVSAHPDRGGIDYVTGAVDADRGNSYEQLYTLRFDGSAPRLLAGSFERLAYGFAWSVDGRWLAYLAPRSGPGESGAREVRLVNLDCRESGECASQAVPAPDNLDLHDLSWSPVEQRLLALGVPQTQAYGASDVFTVFIDPQDGQIILTNLTEFAGDRRPGRAVAGRRQEAADHLQHRRDGGELLRSVPQRLAARDGHAGGGQAALHYAPGPAHAGRADADRPRAGIRGWGEKAARVSYRQRGEAHAGGMAGGQGRLYRAGRLAGRGLAGGGGAGDALAAGDRAGGWAEPGGLTGGGEYHLDWMGEIRISPCKRIRLTTVKSYPRSNDFGCSVARIELAVETAATKARSRPTPTICSPRRRALCTP